MASSPIPCALYTRVSTRNQLDSTYSSLETQRERLEAYCQSQENYAVYRVYEDGAFSADSLDRPALQELLQDIRSGKVSCVLSYKIDRLTRSVKDFHTLMEFFDQHRVKFVSVTQSIDTQHPMGRLLRNVLLDFAQFEREITADRTRDKMHQRAQRGLWNGGTCPYGYQVENKQLVPHEVEAPRVRFIFEQFTQDPSLARLRQALHRRGWYPRSGNAWGKTQLDYILRNVIYCGKIHFHDEIYPGTHAALISESLYQQAQSLHRTRTRVHSHLSRAYLLKGLLRCSSCGSFMTPHYTQKRRKNGTPQRIPYYRCTKTMHHTYKSCGIKQLNADRIEGAVIDYLHDLSGNDAFIQKSVDQLNKDLQQTRGPLEKEAKQVRAQITKIDRELDRYVRALGQGTIALSRLEHVITEREKDKKELERQLGELELKMQNAHARDYSADLLKENLRNFRKCFEGLGSQEQTELLQCLLRDVEVFPDKLVLNVFELPELIAGSQKRKKWLGDQESNLGS